MILIKAVFEIAELGPTDRLVLLSLAEHANDECTCYPSIARICQRTGLGERAVQLSIKRLKEAGYLATKVGGGRGNSTLYTITINPASETPFEKPRITNPVSDDINPAYYSLNPAPDAPEPLLTVIEPSKVYSLSVTDTKTDDGFDGFWAEVPRRVGKEAARKAYAKALRRADAQTILSGIRAYAESRRGQDEQYTAHPATWLNAGRWSDEIKPKGGSNGKGDQRLAAMLRGAAPSVDRGSGGDPPLALLARR